MIDAATDRRLGRAALVLTFVMILVVGVTAAIAFRPKGDIEIPGAWRAQSDYTLVIFGRESCPACKTSIAFHKELAAAAHQRGIRVVAALTASIENPAQFAASIGVAPDDGVRASPAPDHLKSVPTVLVVNRAGDVLKKIEGALPNDKQRAFLEFVKSLR